MAKPKKNLVDAFLFQDAKNAVDLLSDDTTDKTQKRSNLDHDTSNSISGHEQDVSSNITVSEIEHEQSKPISGPEQKQSGIVAGHEQDKNNLITESAYEPSRTIAGSEHDQSSITSLPDQKDIIKRADNEPVHIRSLADKVQIKGSATDQGRITTEKRKKDIVATAARISLSKSQTAVYLWFANRGETGVFNKPEIQRSLSMPYITVRRAIEKLERLDIIELFYDDCQKIFDYKINKNKRLKLAKNVNNASGSEHDQSMIISESLISSSSLNKTTAAEINQDLQHNLELGYWRQKGLSAKQVAEWMKAAGCSYETMRQYLCYCRFDMVDKDLEDKKPVENVFNWFYKIIEKSGSYPKPKGYKSFSEKKLEQERKIVKQREKQAQEAKELYRRKLEAERDTVFWQMMDDENGELFQKCFNQLNDFQKKRQKGRGFAVDDKTSC